MGGVPWVIAVVWAYTHPGLLMTAEALRGVEDRSNPSNEE
jgi:hypothetical protein